MDENSQKYYDKNWTDNLNSDSRHANSDKIKAYVDFSTFNKNYNRYVEQQLMRNSGNSLSATSSASYHTAVEGTDRVLFH